MVINQQNAKNTAFFQPGLDFRVEDDDAISNSFSLEVRNSIFLL